MSIGWPYGIIPAKSATDTSNNKRVKELEAKVAALEIVVGYLTDFAYYIANLRDDDRAAHAAEQARTKFRKKILEKK